MLAERSIHERPVPPPPHARALTFVFLGGGLTGALTLPLGAPEFRWQILAGLIAGAFVIAAVCYFRGARVPEWAYQLFFAYATVAIGLANLLGGTHTAPYLPYFAWMVAYGAYYFGSRALLAQLGLVAASLVVGVAGGVPAGERLVRLVPELATLVALTLVVRRLRVRHDAEVGSLAHAARTDELTGLLNRRAFEDVFAADVRVSHATGRPLSLVLADIDRFKQVNDQHGHRMGDACLSRVAQVLTFSLRGSDFLFRIGGEEFALVLTGTTEPDAVALAEKLRDAIAREDLPGGLRLTMSFGVASLPITATSVAGLYDAADRALYSAKDLGRNRVVPAPSLSPQRPQAVG